MAHYTCDDCGCEFCPSPTVGLYLAIAERIRCVPCQILAVAEANRADARPAPTVAKVLPFRKGA